MWITVLLAFVASSALGQLAPEKYKYYRVQNTKTKRYVSVRDDVGSVNVSKKTADVNAVEMVSGFDNVVSDPATIIGLTDKGAGYFDFSAQGTSVSQIINKNRANVIIKSITDDSYLVYITYKGSSGGMSGYANAYLTDPNSGIVVGYADSQKKAVDGNGSWYIVPVTNDGNNYFGVKMDLNAKGKYYTTLYTDFPYQLADGMRAYVVSAIDGDKVNLEDVGTIIPDGVPVILESNYSSPTQNRLLPLSSSASPLFTKNLLKGVFFNHNAGGKHNVRTSFDKKTMRVLAVKNGEVALVDEGGAYLPANTAYLEVSSGVSSSLTVSKRDSSGNPENPEDEMDHGTATSPISVTDAISCANSIGSEVSSKNFYVKGKISSINYEYSAEYGTATYWQEGQTQIAVGDEVIVCGKIINYNDNTPEFADKKSYLVSLNGKTSSEIVPVENPEDKMDHGTSLNIVLSMVLQPITYPRTVPMDQHSRYITVIILTIRVGRKVIIRLL